MNLRWESENMLWGFFFSLNREAFYVALTLGGVDIEFHIHNLRGVIIQGDEKK